MVEDVLFSIIWISLPFIWHYLLKTAGLSLFRLTIPSFVIIAIYVYQYIGIPALYFKLNSYRAEFVVDKWLMMEVFFYTSLMITMMCMGFILARQLFGKLKLNDAGGVHLSRNYLSRINAGVLLLILISLAVLVYYLSKIGVANVAFLVATGISENHLSSQELRSNMGNAFDGRYHWYKLFMNDLLVFSLLTLLSRYLMLKNVTTTIMLIGALLTTTFVMIMAMEKAPMADLFIALFLVYILVKLNGEVPIKKTLYLFLLLLSMLSSFYVFFMNSESFFMSINSVLSRTFTGQIQPAYHYLDYFKNHDLLLGRSFPNPRDVFPFQHFRLTQEIMAWHNPALSLNGIVGSMPTVFWGEMYANFGFFGVPISSLLVGFGLYSLNAVLLRFKKTPMFIGLYVWLLMHFKTLSGTGLSNFMLDTYMALIIMAFFGLSFYAGLGKIKYNNK